MAHVDGGGGPRTPGPGLLEQQGAPPQVYDRPATPFVARFLGFENLLPGRVAGDEVVTEVGRFRVAPPPRGPEVTLLIKPALEQVTAATDAPPDGAGNIIDGVIDAMAFRGRFCQVWLAAGNRRLLFEVGGDFDHRVGERLRVVIDPAQTLVYELGGPVGAGQE